MCVCTAFFYSSSANFDYDAQTIPSSVINIKLQNKLMLLRKCCNHPYLLEYPLTDDGQFLVNEELIQSSGKLQILDKLLKALKENGHKVRRC